MNLTDGILRACYREGFDQARPMPNDQAVEVSLQLYPTAHFFNKGQRIRLEISSSNFPRFDVNPKFEPGNDLSAVKVTAINSVHVGPDFPLLLAGFQTVIVITSTGGWS